MYVCMLVYIYIYIYLCVCACIFPYVSMISMSKDLVFERNLDATWQDAWTVGLVFPMGALFGRNPPNQKSREHALYTICIHLFSFPVTGKTLVKNTVCANCHCHICRILSSPAWWLLTDLGCNETVGAQGIRRQC